MQRLAYLFVLIPILGCSRRGAPQSEAETPQKPEHALWRGDDVSLETFANGDYELAVTPPGGAKHVVMGKARLTSGAVDLEVARIWRARSPKDNKMGELSPSAEVLGRRIERGKPTTLRLRGTDASSMELCAESCVAVQKKTPTLAGEWRKKGEPDPGGLRRIDLDKHNVRLEFKRQGFPDEAWTGIEAASTGPDTFQLTLPAEHDAGPRTLTLKRLPDETLEACEGTTCTVFERLFNSYKFE